MIGVIAIDLWNGKARKQYVRVISNRAFQIVVGCPDSDTIPVAVTGNMRIAIRAAIRCRVVMQWLRLTPGRSIVFTLRNQDVVVRANCPLWVTVG